MIDATTLLIASAPSLLLLSAWGLRHAVDRRSVRRHVMWLERERQRRVAEEVAHDEAIRHIAAMTALSRTIQRNETGVAREDSTRHNTGGNLGTSLTGQYRGNDDRLQNRVPAAAAAGAFEAE